VLHSVKSFDMSFDEFYFELGLAPKSPLIHKLFIEFTVVAK